MKLIIKSIICLIFGYVSISAYAEQYYFSNLSLRDGLSQITVTAICQDSHGYMWFGSRNGLNKFNGYTFDTYFYDNENNNSLSNNHILCLLEDNDGNLWVGTNNGLNKLDLSTCKITRYFVEKNNVYSLSNNMIYSLCKDEEGGVWIGTVNGLNFYDKEADSFRQYFSDGKLHDNPIYAMCYRDGNLFLGTHRGVISEDLKNGETSKYYPDFTHVRSFYIDKNRKLWIGTQDKGLFIENGKDFVNFNTTNGLSNNYVRSIIASPDGKQMLIGTPDGLNVMDVRAFKIIEQYRDYGNENGNLNHFSIQSMFFDRQNTLWVGTYAGGVNFHSAYGARFRYFNPAEKMNRMTGIIGQAVETADCLYFATEGNGLLEMNKQTGVFRIYPLFSDENAYSQNILKSICLDGNRILCSTNLCAIYFFDLKTKRFTLFCDFKSWNGIYCVGKTSENEIVAGCANSIGLLVIPNTIRNLLQKETMAGQVLDSVVINKFPLKDGNTTTFTDVRCFLEIEKNVFLIGTRYEGLFLYDRKTCDLQQFTSQNSTEKGDVLPENYITSIFCDSQNRIWIGTFGGGFCLFDLKMRRFTNFDTSDGLHDNNVCAIVEDDNRHLWISTISGISDFNPAGHVFRNYTYSSGIKVNEFTPHAGLKTSDGQIVFSGNNGFVMFKPNEISYNPTIPPVVLENLFVKNSKIEAGSKILQKAFSEQKEIVLKRNQTDFSIEYAALNYVFSNKNEYSYKLEGFDTKWNEVGTRRIAYYTNIPEGIYTFKVKAANNDGVWNDRGTEIKIRVLPPPWKTWWAYCLYFVALAGIFRFIYHYFAEKKRLENEMKIQQAQARAQEEFYVERSKLFTNFSHELRTPLTLIINPLDDIAEHAGNLSEDQKKKIALIRNNAQRLLRLVNNLMDFRKNESGTMIMQPAENDFIAFAEEMTMLFRESAVSRKIDFSLNSNIRQAVFRFDKNLMEKVFFNLLSNAFKNTPNGGNVAVKIEKQGTDFLLLEICDSGVGISETELGKIFQPFYQVAQNEHSVSGTGLGLSLSKSIIEMHKGKIWAENNVGKGATFKFILPVGENVIVESNGNVETHSFVSLQNENNTRKHYTVLVVEDDSEVRNYIISHLESMYNIIQAANGEEAIDKAVYHLPDLIISDVKMPKIDGMTMMKTLKNDLHTSHIPIILLTAKALDEDKTESYNIGADDYITKPFKSIVLLARIKNILAGREKLKEIYGKHFTIENLGIKTTSADECFMKKLYEVLEKNVSNPDFKSDDFSREIGMSKANLYRKIKSVTNLSPNEFIRNFRLEMAAKIIKDTDLSVSEIYVTVGFNSLAYFSNCFKVLYGITPTEYAKEKRMD